MSLKRKLPLLIGGLLLVVAAAYSWAAYARLEQMALANAEVRLRDVSTQIAGMLQTNAKALITLTRKTAADEAVRAFLRAPGARTRERATAALRPTGPQVQQVAAVRLRDPSGRMMLEVSSDHWRPAGVTDTAVLQAAAGADSGAVGRIRTVGDSLVYAVAAPVVERGGAGGRLLGYLVTWRRIAGSSQSRESLKRLIGSSASLYVGSGDVWTDLAAHVPPPPVDVGDTARLLSYERPGAGPVLAAAHPIVGLPWKVLVEFPSGEVLAPARRFLGQLIVIAVIVVLIGLLGAWVLSRHITVPLSELTGAAEKIAAGDYSHVTAPGAGRADELGRLADAFTAMATKVNESRQQLEERVRERTAELQERNEELEAFSYSISHDLRAPLRAMQGFSRALLEDYGDRLDPKGREFAERVVAGARGLDQLIQDLLAYSRVSRAELRLGPVDLGRVMGLATRQVETEMRARGARLKIEEPLGAVWGQDATLAQVVANLLGNAIKFVAPDRTPELVVRAETRNGRVRLWVEDNGIGIDPQHHERIFRVFERLHGGEDYPGTGIGLAIVRKGVERMGGRAGVESQLGQGSRFWIELPGADQQVRLETAG
jgi:signal transduction histidine kinase